MVEQADRRIGVEVKLSTAPKVSRGFWQACEDLGLANAYVVAPVLEAYPLAANVEVISPLMLDAVMRYLDAPTPLTKPPR